MRKKQLVAEAMAVTDAVFLSDERTGGFKDKKPLFLLAGQAAKDGV